MKYFRYCRYCQIHHNFFEEEKIARWKEQGLSEEEVEVEKAPWIHCEECGKELVNLKDWISEVEQEFVDGFIEIEHEYLGIVINEEFPYLTVCYGFKHSDFRGRTHSVTIPTEVNVISEPGFLRAPIHKLTINGWVKLNEGAFHGTYLRTVKIPSVLWEDNSLRDAFDPHVILYSEGDKPSKEKSHLEKFYEENGITEESFLELIRAEKEEIVNRITGLEWKAQEVLKDLKAEKNEIRTTKEKYHAIESSLSPEALSNHEYLLIDKEKGSVICKGFKSSIPVEPQSVVIPEGVEIIDVGAFSDKGIKNLSLGNGVREIRSSAFQTHELISLELPENLQTIGRHAFSGNGSLTELKINGKNIHFGEYAFAGNQIKELKLPSGEVSFDEGAFAGNALTRLTIPGGVKTIAPGVFAFNQIESLLFKKGIQTIESRAFMMNQLKMVTLPKSIEYFEGAFDSTVEIIIEDSVAEAKTVDVKSSDNVKILFEKARKARDENDWENAIQYYKMIPPKDYGWEVGFYIDYYYELLHQKGNIIKAIDDVEINLDDVFNDIILFVDTEKQMDVISEVMTQSMYVAETLLHRAISKYKKSVLMYKPATQDKHRNSVYALMDHIEKIERMLFDHFHPFKEVKNLSDTTRKQADAFGISEGNVSSNLSILKELTVNARRKANALRLSEGNKMDKLKILYEKAREAREDELWSTALKYYEMILYIDFRSWEANFYTKYYKALHHNEYICDVAKTFSTGIDLVLSNIDIFVASTEEQINAFSEVMRGSMLVAETLLDEAKKKYKNNQSLTDKTETYLDSVVAVCNLCDVLASSLDKVFSGFWQARELSVKAWKQAIAWMISENHVNHTSRIYDYSRKIRKYEPSYITPKPQPKIGCYIATSIYGSYDCPEVWTLRRYRDLALAKSRWGNILIQSYYRISPMLMDRLGRTKWVRRILRSILDKLVEKLQAKGYEGTIYQDHK